jgi:VanZ family protein
MPCGADTLRAVDRRQVLAQLSDRLSPEWRHRLFITYVVGMGLVFLTPMPDAGMESRFVDKAVHFGMFVGFALVLHWDRRTNPGLTFLLSAILAAAIELVQWVLPFRDAEWEDLAAGLLGAALVTIPGLWMRRERPSRTER